MQALQLEIGKQATTATIDRISVLGKVRYVDLYEQRLRRCETVKKVKQAIYPYRTAYITTDGVYIEVKGADAPKDLPDVRIDFNPNSVAKENKPELHSIIDALARPRLSRLDVAIDYYGRDMATVEWREKRVRSREMIMSPKGRLETLYIGSRKSNSFLRIYDKAKEQGENANWWRVESMQRYERGQKVFDKNPFEGLVGYEQGTNAEGLTIEEVAMIMYIEKYPSALGELSKYQRQKYRQLLASPKTQIEPAPSQVFEQEKGHLLEQVTEWVKPLQKHLTKL